MSSRWIRTISTTITSYIEHIMEIGNDCPDATASLRGSVELSSLGAQILRTSSVGQPSGVVADEVVDNQAILVCPLVSAH